MVPSTTLNTSDAEPLATYDGEGGTTSVNAVYTQSGPYMLNYTGNTINELLGLVYDNREALSSLDTYVDDKINTKLEEDITQAIDDEY